MKEIISIILIVFGILFVNAQGINIKPGEILTPVSKENKTKNKPAYFSLTRKGWTNYQDTTKSYTVYECEGLNVSQIHNTVVKYLKNKDLFQKGEILSNSDNLVIYRNIAQDIISDESKTSYDIIYSISMDIKDGKIRFNYPVIVDLKADLGIGKFSVGKSEFEKIYKSPNSKILGFNSILKVLILGITSDLKDEQKNSEW